MLAVLWYFRYNALSTLHVFFGTPGCWVNRNFEVRDEFFNRYLIFCSKTFCYWLCTFYPRRMLLLFLHLLENGKAMEYTYTNIPDALFAFLYTLLVGILFISDTSMFLITLSHYRYHTE
jgi:hypothetical protein